MTVRFLADEDIDANIIDGLRLKESSIDVLDVKTAGLRGIDDQAILDLAAQEERIVITHDRNTMIREFHRRVVTGKSTPGLFILPQQSTAIGSIVDSLLLIWTASRAEEWRNQIAYLPFR